MKTIDDYKDKILNMFYLSIDNDIDNWYKDHGENFYSQEYNGFKLNIDLSKNTLYINEIVTNSYTHILSYSKTSNFFSFFISELRPNNSHSKKVREYVEKLKINHVNKLEAEKNKKDIDKMKTIIEGMEKTYIKEIRKEKLDNIP